MKTMGVILLIAMVAHAVKADTTMICRNNDMLTTGDSEAKLIIKCGKPDFIAAGDLWMYTQSNGKVYVVTVVNHTIANISDDIGGYEND